MELNYNDPIMEPWEMCSIPSLPLLIYTLSPRGVVPDRVLSMGPIELFKHLTDVELNWLSDIGTI